MIYPPFRAAAESHVAGWLVPGAVRRAFSVEPSSCGC